MDEITRNQKIIKTSVIGVVINVLLSALKFVIGLLTNSIAITLDAINNISDAVSSVITIIGTKLAGKDADKKHPFGYGRVEYFSALIISLIVLYAGITSLEESINSIRYPEMPTYTVVSLVIVAIGVIVKIALGRYFVAVGKKVDSGSLVGSGQEATLDSIISLSTLVAAGIYLGAGVSLEAYLGAIISIVIIKSGIDMLRETVSRLLGEQGDIELARDIKATVCEFDDVEGAYDLVLNDYGPNVHQGSIHIAVPDMYSVSQLDDLIRHITAEVYQKHHVVLTAVGVYSINTQDAQAVAMEKRISEIAMTHEYITQMHGFYLDKENKVIRLDLVVSFNATSRREAYAKALADIQKEYPDYTVVAAMDTDFFN